MLNVLITLSVTTEDGIQEGQIEDFYNKANDAKDMFMQHLNEFGVVERTPFKISLSERPEEES